MKTGRPVKTIDLKQLKQLMELYPSLEESAGWFDCSPDTITRTIETNFNMTFAEFRRVHTGRTRLNIKRVALKKALEGNDKLLIYLLRTMTNLDDRPATNRNLGDVSSSELISDARDLLDQLQNQS
jgi:hypothetical protein